MRRTWLNREFECTLVSPGTFDGILRITHEIIEGKTVEIKNEIFGRSYSNNLFSLHIEHNGLTIDVPPVDLNTPNLKELLLKEKIESLMLTLQHTVNSLRKIGTVKVLKDRATYDDDVRNFNFKLEVQNNAI